MKLVELSAVPLIPVGTIILVNPKENIAPSSVWAVFHDGKVVAVDENYPHGETEDIEWLAPADIYIIGSVVPF